MLDFVFRGGQVVTPWGVGNWDVAVQGEKIVAVSEQGTLTEDVGRIIDTSGKVVVPGGIEPHAHIAAPIAGHPGMETMPPPDVSRAALHGGTTTLIDFAIQHPGHRHLPGHRREDLSLAGAVLCRLLPPLHVTG